MQRSKSRKSDVYRVERLVAKRIRSSRVEYLVKWKNWSEAHNSWEPEKNILDKRLIESFLRSEKRKKGKDADSSAVSLDTTQSSTDTSLSSPTSPVPDCKRSAAVGVVPSTAAATSTTAATPDATASSNTPSTQPSCNAATTITTSNVRPTSTPSPTHPLSDSEPKAINSTVSSTLTTTSSWSEVGMSPSHPATSVSAWDSIFDRQSDRRFRQSTMIAAVASASLASSRKTARLMCSSSSYGSIGSPPHSRSTVPDSSPQHQRTPTDTDCTGDERPKIRITIPRDILLACPPPGVPSSSSSTSRDSSQLTANSSASTDELEHTSLSGADSSTMDAEDPSTVPPRFLAPVELPRRSAPSSNASPVSIVNLRVSEPTILSDHHHHHHHNHIDALSPTIGVCRSPPKWVASRTTKDASPPTSSILVPKFVLLNSLEAHHPHHHKRRYSDESGAKSDEFSDGHHVLDAPAVKRRKHSDRKEKRRRKRMQDDSSVRGFVSDAESASPFDISPSGFPGPTKIRRRSGSSNSHASTVSSSDGFSPTPSLPTPTSSEDTPRVAPLRIQLRSLPAPISGGRITVFPDSRISPCSPSPKGSFTSTFSATPLNRLRDRSNRSTVPQPRVTLLTPDPKRLRLVQEICVTDVTVGGLTISIKECSGPDDFFGVPSSQLVQWTSPKPPALGPTTHTEPLTSVKPEHGTDLVPSSQSAHQQETDERPYRDENVAPSDLLTQETAPKLRIGLSNSPTRPMCNLSTIYEESTLELSKSSKRSDNMSPVVLSGTPPSPHITQSNEPVKPIQSSTPDKLVDHSIRTHSLDVPSTSALMLAATEAVLKSTDEPPSSPGLLTPPRRASTPVNQSTCSTVADCQISASPDPVLTTAPPTVVSTSPNPTAPISATSTTPHNPPSTSTTNSSITRPSIPPKTPTFTNPISIKIGSAPVRPRATGQKGVTASNTSADHPRRSKSRDSASASATATTKAARLLTGKPVLAASRSSTSSAHDPASVYTFSDSSPVHHLSPRTRPPSHPTPGLTAPASSSASSNIVRKPASSTPTNMLGLMESVDISVAPLILPCSQMNTFSPLLGLQSPHGFMNMPGPQTSLALTLSTLTGQSPICSNNTDSAAFATAIYMQQLRMQFLGADNITPTSSSGSSCISSNTGLPILNSVSSSSSVTPWAPIHPLPDNLTNALNSLLPSSGLMMTNDSLFGSPFPLPTGASPVGRPSLSSAPNSSMVVVPTAANLMLPAQLQLADMVAAAVNQSAVFNTSSSRELYPSSDHQQQQQQLPFLADERPMDLSAKR